MLVHRNIRIMSLDAPVLRTSNREQLDTIQISNRIAYLFEIRTVTFVYLFSKIIPLNCCVDNIYTCE